jgi:alpha-glucosidase/oligosaccharide 4-alpha-D-glucosyltransferase
VLFEQPDGNAASVSSTYFWGDFLVAPVVESGATRKEVWFPVKDSLAKVVQSTRDYSSRSIDLYYYHDASVATTRAASCMTTMARRPGPTSRASTRSYALPAA